MVARDITLMGLSLTNCSNTGPRIMAASTPRCGQVVARQYLMIEPAHREWAGQSGPLELGVSQIAKPCRLQAGPPEPVTRCGRFDWAERVILQGSEQTPRFRRFPWHVWSLFARSIGALSCRMTRPTPPPSSLWVDKQR